LTGKKVTLYGKITVTLYGKITSRPEDDGHSKPWSAGSSFVWKHRFEHLNEEYSLALPHIG